MATTIQPSDLKVTVTETLTLNGTNYNTTTEYAVPSATNYVSNVFNVEIGSQAIILFARTGIAARNGEYVIEDTKYLRLTNGDDTDSVTVSLNYLTSGDQEVTIAAGGSFILTDFDLGSGDTLLAVTIITTMRVDIPYVIGLA